MRFGQDSPAGRPDAALDQVNALPVVRADRQLPVVAVML
jgi:hypothetical protein